MHTGSPDTPMSWTHCCSVGSREGGEILLLYPAQVRPSGVPPALELQRRKDMELVDRVQRSRVQGDAPGSGAHLLWRQAGELWVFTLEKRMLCEHLIVAF